MKGREVKVEMKKEKEMLESIKSKYNALICEYEIKNKDAIKEYNRNPVLYAGLIENYTHKIKMLQKTIKNPFFGRIDFKEQNDRLVCYIGKVGVLDDDGNTITVDWRAPISSLYYDSDVGNASYNSPSGIINGILELKRQFTIEDGILKDFQDVNTISNDELLKPFLENSIDNRLKNIVSTIQKEQNDIIRIPLRKNIIAQGAAGCGKTTVALHRIAYLVYNEQKNYKEDAFLVIGPNDYFLKYISSVLPDLDVFNVKQYTFLDIVNNYLNEKIKIIDSFENLENILNGMDISNIKFKSSLKYKDILEKYIDSIEQSVIHGSIKLMDYILFKEDVINNFLKKKSLGIVERINDFIKYAKGYIKKHEDNIKNDYWLKYRDEYLNSKDENRKKEILDITEKFNQDLKNIDLLLKSYFKAFMIKPMEIYKNFINNFSSLSSFPLNVNETIKRINKRTLGYEDLAALVYINLRFYGYKGYDKYIHVALDEAQDFGLFHYFVIKSLFKNATFSIFGDLAQSIFSYQSISNWSDVKDTIFGGNFDIMYLDKSYRTTCEIMDAANEISRLYGFGNAKSFLRHGPDVEKFSYKNIDLTRMVETLKNEGYTNVAIIGKCKDSIKQFQNDEGLKDIIITSYMSKGLEFDACIILDVDFNRENSLDMKLLYVAMTRALHKMIVVMK